MHALFHKILTFHWITTFLLMGLFSLLGAAASFNLFFMFSANLRLLSQHGLMAVMEGALTQTGQLLMTGAFALAMYLGFKACEHVLVAKILRK